MSNKLNFADAKRSDSPNHLGGTAGTDPARQYINATVTVAQPMNSHGGMRLSAATGNQVFQVVDYATEEIQHSMDHTEEGALIEVRLVRLGSRGDAWRVVAVAAREY